MRNYKTFFKISASLLLFSQTIIAQVSDEDLDDFLGFNDTVNDAPEASISSLVLMGIVLALFVGYRKLQHRHLTSKSTQLKSKDYYIISNNNKSTT